MRKSSKGKEGNLKKGEKEKKESKRKVRKKAACCNQMVANYLCYEVFYV